MSEFDMIREDVLKWSCSQVLKAQLLLMNCSPLFDIEVSSICNLECKFCPRSKIIRKNKFMNPELFDILCNWLPDDAIVMFSGLGESLLNGNLSSYVRKLKEKNISSCVVTNGVFLTPEKQEELIESGINQIQISYHTLDEYRYAELTGNKGDFKSLNRNIEHLSKSKPDTLRVQLNFVDLGSNSEERFAIKDFASKLGFDFFYRREHSRGGSNLKSNHSIKKEESCFRCGTFAYVYFISSDGSIPSCVNDTQSLNVLGNIATSDYPFIRKNKLSTIYTIGFDVCDKCTDDYRWYSLYKIATKQV